ncbi:hypothetical protein [Streptomyces roseoverticillatus]|uniref:Uncharacterized protein n=1 Tax=Streptomyces roseoverticillatus TaxID=66429 RepID=A0ABV3IX24_9ACTN
MVAPISQLVELWGHLTGALPLDLDDEYTSIRSLVPKAAALAPTLADAPTAPAAAAVATAFTGIGVLAGQPLITHTEAWLTGVAHDAALVVRTTAH